MRYNRKSLSAVIGLKETNESRERAEYIELNFFQFLFLKVQWPFSYPVSTAD